jgi:predicted O-methyltransferase YrrM
MINLAYWLKNPNKIVSRVRYWLYEKRNQDKPWLCPGTIDFLNAHLTKEMVGVEFGSGRSTHWLANRMKSLTSIEHHDGWYNIVKQQLQSSELGNVDYRLVPLDHPESEPERDHYDPIPRYVSVLLDLPPDSLDFVLVDGHYRSTCIQCALTKLKVDGLLVVDDIEFWYLLGGPPVPSNWECVNSSNNGLKSTKIWKRV